MQTTIVLRPILVSMGDSDRVREAEQLVLEVDPSDHDDPRIVELHDRAVDVLGDLAVQLDQ